MANLFIVWIPLVVGACVGATPARAGYHRGIPLVRKTSRFERDFTEGSRSSGQQFVYCCWTGECQECKREHTTMQERNTHIIIIWRFALAGVGHGANCPFILLICVGLSSRVLTICRNTSKHVRADMFFHIGYVSIPFRHDGL